ncbi:MAG: hypothetical protein N2043_13180 [Ignavibacterium sp.]|nr:hypothetical protein [Ignavibacterium sp.]
MKQSVLIGIGGCGTKCVEAAIHLAASQKLNNFIYPIIIDQDKANGNIERLKNVINSYLKLNEASKGIPRDWPFSNIIKKYDELLPIAPVNENLNFASAIGEPSMSKEEQKLVGALFTPNQLSDYVLNQGFKKRAHMGSLLFEDFINREKNKDLNEEGLNKICNELKASTNVEVTIFASLFGGTGISGFNNIGKYFKEKLSNAQLRVVLLTPYFSLNSHESSNEDAALVKSDSDMVATRIALEIYGSEIKKVFNKIMIIGSDLKHVGDEKPSENYVPYGRNQVNKAHVFELIAASSIFNELQQKDGVLEFNINTTREKLPVTIGSHEVPLNEFFESIGIDLNNLKKLLNFSRLLSLMHEENLLQNESWSKRQPWINRGDQDTLINWGVRYFNWFKEMKNWKLINLDYESIINKYDPYKFNSKLTIYLHKNKNDLGSLLKTIEILKM